MVVVGFWVVVVKVVAQFSTFSIVLIVVVFIFIVIVVGFIFVGGVGMSSLP